MLSINEEQIWICAKISFRNIVKDFICYRNNAARWETILILMKNPNVSLSAFRYKTPEWIHLQPQRRTYQWLLHAHRWDHLPIICRGPVPPTRLISGIDGTAQGALGRPTPQADPIKTAGTVRTVPAVFIGSACGVGRPKAPWAVPSIPEINRVGGTGPRQIIGRWSHRWAWRSHW